MTGGKLNPIMIESPVVIKEGGGAGASANMNADEVIADRACGILGSSKGDGRVRPGDHVNMAQSTDGVFPSAGKLLAPYRLIAPLSSRPWSLRRFPGWGARSCRTRCPWTLHRNSARTRTRFAAVPTGS